MGANEISLADHKKIIFDILCDIKSFCNENGIRYFIAYGTALGAVRHNGFIPWDDDIDICMTRSEYKKFKSLYIKRKSRFELLDYQINDCFDTPLPKIVDTTTILSQYETNELMPIGLYVDIFIYDNVPDGQLSRKLYLSALTFLQKCWGFIHYRRNYPKISPQYISYKVATTIFKPIFFVRMLDKIAGMYHKKETKCVGSMLFSSNRFKYVFPKEWFGKGKTLYFEGEDFTAPLDVDSYLKCIYGDYMQLPPVEKRKSDHIFKAYYK